MSSSENQQKLKGARPPGSDAELEWEIQRVVSVDEVATKDRGVRTMCAVQWSATVVSVHDLSEKAVAECRKITVLGPDPEDKAMWEVEELSIEGCMENEPYKTTVVKKPLIDIKRDHVRELLMYYKHRAIHYYNMQNVIEKEKGSEMEDDEMSDESGTSADQMFSLVTATTANVEEADSGDAQNEGCISQII